MNYELLAGEALLATLRFRSSLGTLATAETAAGCWTFKRVGFWQTRLTVRDCGLDQDVAVFKNNTWSGGGTLEFGDGRIYRATTNFWQTNLDFKNNQDGSLLRFHSRGFFHFSANVDIDRAAARLPELPLLITLGWYLIVMLQQDAAAGVAATAAVAGVAIIQP
jgi:hypothetical protein